MFSKKRILTLFEEHSETIFLTNTFTVVLVTVWDPLIIPDGVLFFETRQTADRTRSPDTKRQADRLVNRRTRGAFGSHRTRAKTESVLFYEHKHC